MYLQNGPPSREVSFPYFWAYFNFDLFGFISSKDFIQKRDLFFVIGRRNSDPIIT